ncbi:MAG: DUF488 domain-containing protein [Gemmataceae bacterium]|nr:DUF488 domain-containing protein [Gemmataceae bacterium]
MSAIRLFTIGFTKKGAERFFTLLGEAGVERVLDVRLNNVSQLAGFAKKDDLAYFLRAIGPIGYAHLPDLAPTQDILDAYKKEKGDWALYEQRFLDLMRARRIEDAPDRALFDKACLLCSEDGPHRCHRRLVAEYLRERWGEVEITHLK